jgi:hypothetical protein
MKQKKRNISSTLTYITKKHTVREEDRKKIITEMEVNSGKTKDSFFTRRKKRNELKPK